MKTKLCFLMLAGLAVAGILIPRSAEAQPVSTPKAASIESPVGLECVVTVEMQSWMERTSPPSQPSGFQSDYTVRGKVAEMGPEWVILKDGNFENWISRDKVLSIRISRGN